VEASDKIKNELLMMLDSFERAYVESRCRRCVNKDCDELSRKVEIYSKFVHDVIGIVCSKIARETGLPFPLAYSCVLEFMRLQELVGAVKKVLRDISFENRRESDNVMYK